MKPQEWLDIEYELQFEDYEIRPSVQQAMDRVLDNLQGEISQCRRMEERGEETDYDFFIQCEAEYKEWRVYKLLCKTYGEGYVSKYIYSHTRHQMGFHIDRYYDWIESSILKELVTLFDDGEYFIKRDETNRLTIVVKSEE